MRRTYTIGAAVLVASLTMLAACGTSSGDASLRACPVGYERASDGQCTLAADPAPPGGMPGAWVDVAVRPDGRAVVATYDAAFGALAVGWEQEDGSIRYHYPDGAGDPSRHIPPVANDAGQSASIAVGSDGQARVAYLDRDLGELRFARFDGVAWNVEVVDGGEADRGQFASLALDSHDQPHIAYYDATHRVLRYATRGTGGWATETVPLVTTDDDELALVDETSADYGRYASLALSLGAPVVAFYEATGGDLFVATRAADGWRTILIDGRDTETGANAHDVGQHASLAVNERGDISVAYHDATVGALRFVHGVSGVLSVEVADDGATAPEGETWQTCERHIVGAGASLALDSLGRARIAYFDATTLTLRLAVREGAGRWRLRVLASQPGAGVWLSHASLGDLSFIAYADIDLYRTPPIALRLMRVEP